MHNSLLIYFLHFGSFKSVYVQMFIKTEAHVIKSFFQILNTGSCFPRKQKLVRKYVPKHA